jgi:hypothetical protein
VCGKSDGPADGRTAAETLFDRIRTPPKVQKLQRTLYRKAKAEPGYRFYSRYGEMLRHDVLETAMSAVASNAGAAGVDGQECSAYAGSEAAGGCSGRIIKPHRIGCETRQAPCESLLLISAVKIVPPLSSNSSHRPQDII